MILYGKRIARNIRFPYIYRMASTLTPIRVTLKDARDAARLTQAELAAKADVRQATISDMETGAVRRVSLDVLERICRVLGKTPGELLILEPNTTPAKKRR